MSYQGRWSNGYFKNFQERNKTLTWALKDRRPRFRYVTKLAVFVSFEQPPFGHVDVVLIQGAGKQMPAFAVCYEI